MRSILFCFLRDQNYEGVEVDELFLLCSNLCVFPIVSRKYYSEEYGIPRFGPENVIVSLEMFQG